jgi:hypothetical protein
MKLHKNRLWLVMVASLMFVPPAAVARWRLPAQPEFTKNKKITQSAKHVAGHVAFLIAANALQVAMNAYYENQSKGLDTRSVTEALKDSWNAVFSKVAWQEHSAQVGKIFKKQVVKDPFGHGISSATNELLDVGGMKLALGDYKLWSALTALQVVGLIYSGVSLKKTFKTENARIAAEAAQQLATQQLATQQLAAQQLATQQLATQQLAAQQLAAQQLAAQQLQARFRRNNGRVLAEAVRLEAARQQREAPLFGFDDEPILQDDFKQAVAASSEAEAEEEAARVEAAAAAEAAEEAARVEAAAREARVEAAQAEAPASRFMIGAELEAAQNQGPVEFFAALPGYPDLGAAGAPVVTPLVTDSAPTHDDTSLVSVSRRVQKTVPWTIDLSAFTPSQVKELFAQVSKLRYFPNPLDYSRHNFDKPSRVESMDPLVVVTPLVRPELDDSSSFSQEMLAALANIEAQVAALRKGHLIVGETFSSTADEAAQEVTASQPSALARLSGGDSLDELVAVVDLKALPAAASVSPDSSLSGSATLGSETGATPFRAKRSRRGGKGRRFTTSPVRTPEKK